MKEDPFRHMEVLVLFRQIHLHCSGIGFDLCFKDLLKPPVYIPDPFLRDILRAQAERNGIKKIFQLIRTRGNLSLPPCDLYFRNIRQCLKERRRNKIKIRGRRRQMVRPGAGTEGIQLFECMIPCPLCRFLLIRPVIDIRYESVLCKQKR